LADVDNGRHIGCRFFARPSIGLHEELILEIIDTESAEMRTGEVKDLTSGGRSFACKKVHLVIAVEMVLVVSAPSVTPLRSCSVMFGFPAAAASVGSQSSPEKTPFSTEPGLMRPGQRMIAGTRKPPS